MKVSLVDYTGCGCPDPARQAANVLVFTKNTRLNMTPGLFDDICARPWPDIEEELAYMANTIPSSWEFVNYSFLITDVTRAFTHQFVRTRTGSYAQQTMRVLDVTGWTYGRGPTTEHPLPPIESDDDHAHQLRAAFYDSVMDYIADAYRDLIDMGANIEDARGVLPTNIHTNIAAKFSLRCIADMVRKRSSPRTQGEYRSVLDAMRAEVLRVHPWAALFLDRDFDRAAHDLDMMIAQSDMSPERRTKMMKLVDQMRGLS
jgi:flavin-dependent thymidylate synthase